MGTCILYFVIGHLCRLRKQENDDDDHSAEVPIPAESSRVPRYRYYPFYLPPAVDDTPSAPTTPSTLSTPQTSQTPSRVSTESDLTSNATSEPSCTSICPYVSANPLSMPPCGREMSCLTPDDAPPPSYASIYPAGDSVI